MTEGPRRGVTRGYVGGLIAAVIVTAAALTVAAWGLISLAIGRSPVVTPGIGLAAAPLIIVCLLGLLAWLLWVQAIAMLRGTRTMLPGVVVGAAAGAYLGWSAVGFVFGMRLEDTLLSPFCIALAVIWIVAAVLFWALFSRRIFTDLEQPKWPWERNAEDEA